MPRNDTTKLLMGQAISQLSVISAALAALSSKMQRLAAALPEYALVMKMFGPALGPHLLPKCGGFIPRKP